MAVRSAKVTSLAGLGPKFAAKLENLGLYTKLDLALHLPFRYQDRTVFSPMSSMVTGEEYFTQGIITQINNSDRGELLIEFSDETGLAVMRLIHASRINTSRLAVGNFLRVYGQLRHQRQFIHPEFSIYVQDPGPPTPYYHPIYRTTAGISSNRLRQWIEKSLPELNFLPKYEQNGLTLPEAIRVVHHPDSTKGLDDAKMAQERIAFDEVMAYILVGQKLHRERRRSKTAALPSKQNLSDQFLKALPYELTNAQKRVIEEVHADLSLSQPMRRLLQGDVGSGKTVVALLAALRAAENNFQTAVMAPTEILVEQHYETFSEWLAPLGINVSLMTGSMTAKARRITQQAISDGESLIAVGTHALFQRAVQFKNLGLAIVDEQHRFGVHQRMQLRGKGSNPHQLVMTATPIPRTLAMAIFADMETSTIDEMPKGRPAIHTSIHSSANRDDIIAGVDRQLNDNRQVFWVCPAIGDNRAQLVATEDILEELKHKLPDAKIGQIHGRMKTEQKSEIMQQFRDQEIQLLVATTVIEVGIDVPNASIMVIESADHLGLAQLHQLRGRIGRGTIESYCMLLYEPPLSEMASARLQAIRNNRDGFEIANLDYQLRGQGQIFGTLQAGSEHFKIADSDSFLKHHAEAFKVVSQLAKSDPDLGQEIIDTWTSSEPGYVAM